MSYHMRRKDLEITDVATLKKILKLSKYVTVALAKNNQPYLVSLSCGYDESGNSLYFHCANDGKKIDYLKTNNVVWGQALFDEGYQDDDCDHFFATVHFRGRVTFIRDIGQKRKAVECMIRHLNSNPEVMMAKTKPERLAETTFGRIDIDFMSGKKHGKVNL